MAKVTRGAGTTGIKSGDVKKIKKGSKKKYNTMANFKHKVFLLIAK